jgi:hypothetical protein
MKKFFWFFLFSGFVLQSFCEKSLASLAISQIIRDFFVKNSDNFDFIIYGSRTKELLKIVGDVVKLTETLSTVIQVKNGKSKIKVDRSSVMMFDTYKSYQDFHERAVLYETYPREFHFLVYIAEEETENLTKNVELNSYFLFVESFLVGRRNFSLKTFVTYQQSLCEKLKQIIVNQFSETTRKWKLGDFFIEKFHNFNGCEFVICPVHNPPVFGLKYKDEKFVDVWGYGVIFNDEISKALNYSYIYNPINGGNDSLGFDFPLFALSMRHLHSINAEASLITRGFASVDEIILISRSPPYSQFEKIFLPFDVEVWHWLIATIVLAVVVIILLKLTPKRIQKFVFGLKVQTPLLNLM